MVTDLTGTVKTIIIHESAMVIKIIESGDRESGATLWSATANPDASPLTIGAQLTLLSNALINGNTVHVVSEDGIINSVTIVKL